MDSLDSTLGSLKTTVMVGLAVVGIVITVAAAAVTLAVIFGGGGDSTVTIEIGESLAEILRDR